MRKIKQLALIVAAVCLLAAALGVSAASGAAKFTSSSGGKALSETTQEEYEFEVTFSDLDCEVVNFSGNTPGLEAASFTVNPSFEDCDISSISATVNTVGCSFTFSAATEGERATLLLANCSNGAIIFEAHIPFFAKCVVKIPNQSIASAASYTSSANGIDLKLAATTVKAEVTTSTGACPLTVAQHENVVYNGQSRIEASGATFTWDAS